jgi:hypothetical protein
MSALNALALKKAIVFFWVGALDKQLAVFRERAKAEQEKKKKERNKKKAAARAAAIKRKADRQAAAGDAK